MQKSPTCFQIDFSRENVKSSAIPSLRVAVFFMNAYLQSNYMSTRKRHYTF